LGQEDEEGSKGLRYQEVAISLPKGGEDEKPQGGRQETEERPTEFDSLKVSVQLHEGALMRGLVGGRKRMQGRKEKNA